MDKLLETDQAEEFRLAKESFQLLAYAHRDISNIRRQQLKGVVSDKYKQLCNDSTPLTGNLLGDDLEKQIKTLDEMRKVGFDLSTIRNKDRTVGKYQPRSSTSSYSKQKNYNGNLDSENSYDSKGRLGSDKINKLNKTYL